MNALILVTVLMLIIVGAILGWAGEIGKGGEAAKSGVILAGAVADRRLRGGPGFRLDLSGRGGLGRYRGELPQSGSVPTGLFRSRVSVSLPGGAGSGWRGARPATPRPPHRTRSSTLPSALRSSRSVRAAAASSRSYTEPTSGDRLPSSSIGVRTSHCSRRNSGRASQ